MAFGRGFDITHSLRLTSGLDANIDVEATCERTLIK